MNAAIGPLGGVTAERVGRWASRWTDTGLWDEVLLLANRVWVASSSSDQALAWHHLLLAVGNFKRQGGRRIRPAIELPALAPVEPMNTFVTPTGVLVDVDAVASWEALSDSIPGVATPTCTTLLAALWPNRHFVFDWRVRAVASGILRANGWPACPSIEAVGEGTPGPVTMSDYDHIRNHVRAADLDMVLTERAFYEVSRKVRMLPGRTWKEYGDQTLDLLKC